MMKKHTLRRCLLLLLPFAAAAAVLWLCFGEALSDMIDVAVKLVGRP